MCIWQGPDYAVVDSQIIHNLKDGETIYIKVLGYCNKLPYTS